MIRVCMSALLLAAAAVPASAQAPMIPARLSLDEALRLARERNPTLAAVRNLVEAAAGDRLQAKLKPNPALTVDSENYPLFDGNRPAFLDNQQLTLRIDQEIELAGRRRLRTQVADAGVAVAEAAAHDQQRRLELEVRRTYLSVVLAKADVDVARTTLDEIDKVITLNRARYEQGEISGVEVRRTQVERLRFVDDVFAAQLALRNAKSALLALLNAPDLAVEFDVAGTLASDPPVPGAAITPTVTADRSALREQALTARPDMAAARYEVQRASSETSLQRAIRTPNVTVGGGYQRNFGADAVVFGVTVPLPLRHRNQGAIARAAAEEQRARNLAAAVTAAVSLDVQQAANGVEISQQRVAYIEREYLTPARESRDIVMQSYRLGTADLIDFLDAQRAYRDTLRTYNRALYDRRLSTFELSAAMADDSAAQVIR